MALDIAQQLEQAARHHSSGDAASAIVLYRAILDQSPHQPDALLMMGVIAKQAGNTELALKMIEAAIAARQDFPAAWIDHSLILRSIGRYEDAVQSARIAVQSAPDLADAWDALALAFKDIGNTVEAAACSERAVGMQPENPHFLGNYAAILFAKGDWQAACLAACQAEAIDPQWPSMILGTILKAMGYPQLAALRFAHTRVLRPDFAEASVSEAMVLLQMGDFEQGWALWEQRPDFATDLQMLPLWQGQRVTHLVVYEDQGLGDAIHFARYLSWLRTRVGKITLHVSAPLHRLFAASFPDIVIVGDDVVPLADARCRLSSLPVFAATRLDTIPAKPYLKAPTSKSEKISALPTPRIGLVWAGNPHFRNDRTRSIAYEKLRPLIATGAQHFVSLQKNHAAPDIFDIATDLSDFSDTAAAINMLDLLITVDTAVAHLAGALGKPVFILLPFDSDWRWLLGREDSPWYPSARLFRQIKPGDWDGVIASVASEVQKFIAGDSAVLKPQIWRGESLRQNPYALPLNT